jgi:hypothetical protein
VHMLPPGDLYQIVTRGSVTATGGVQRPVLNSWSYLADHLSVGGNFPTNTVWAAFFATVWGAPAPFQAGLDNSYIGMNSFGTIAEGSVLWSHNDPAVPPNGSGGMGREPLQTSVCYSMRTASRGRIYQGRKFSCPVPSANVAGDELTGAAYGGYNSIGLQFLTPLVVVFGGVNWTLRPVIWSQLYTTLVPGATGLVGDFLTSVHVNKTLSSWRHRRERTIR